MRDPFRPRSRSRVSKVLPTVEDAEPVVGDGKKLDKAVTKLKNKKSGNKAKGEADTK